MRPDRSEADLYVLDSTAPWDSLAERETLADTTVRENHNDSGWTGAEQPTAVICGDLLSYGPIDRLLRS